MNGKMQALVKAEAAPGAVIQEVDIPKIGPKDILVKVHAAAICGTDIHIFHWNKYAQDRIKPPMIFGHEFAGEVIEVGSPGGGPGGGGTTSPVKPIFPVGRVCCAGRASSTSVGICSS